MMPRTFLALLMALAALSGAVPVCGVEAGAAHAAELVMFERDGCPWCQRWHQEIGTGYPKTDEGQRAPLRVLRSAEPDKIGAALKSPVTMAPTFVLFDKGREVGRIVGYPGADFFYGLLGELIQKLDRGSGLDPTQPASHAKSPS